MLPPKVPTDSVYHNEQTIFDQDFREKTPATHGNIKTTEAVEDDH